MVRLSFHVYCLPSERAVIHRCHGLRMARVSSCDAPESSRMTSRSGSQRILRPVRIVIMLSCVMAVFLYYVLRGFANSEGYFVFAAESIALIAFGISWFTEGLDLKKELVIEEGHKIE